MNARVVALFLLFSSTAFAGTGDGYTPPPIPTGTAGDVVTFGAGGTPADSGIQSLSTVSPEAYGAKGNAATYFDGAVTSTFTGATATGSSTTPTASSVTTVNNNDVVLSVFVTVGYWSTAPAVVNTRLNAYAAGAYEIFVGDQTVPTAGLVASISGTYSTSAAWGTASIPLVPTSGNTITYVGGSTYQSATTGPISLAKPTGVVAGDYLVACVGNYTTPSTPKSLLWMPQGFQQIVGFTNVGNNVTCWGKVATGSEPSTYTITYGYNSTSGQTAVLLDYRNVAGPENVSRTLTSASAGFTGAAAGRDICIASIYGPTKQQQACGTITAVNSPSSVNVSFNLPTTVSGVQFAFGTDDTTAFTSMLSSAPCSTVGCAVALGMKHYALTGPLTLPPNLAISFVGQGPGIPNTAPNYISGSVPLANAITGTQLQWLTQGLSQAAITVGGTLHVTNTSGSDTIKNLAVVGGVGIGMDGGGSNGLAALNAQNVWIDNAYVNNFYGIGVYVDGMAASNIKDWIGGIYLNNLVIENNALSGVQVGSSLAVQNVSVVNILNTFLMGNGGPALSAAGNEIQGMLIEGNTIAWDNVLSYPRLNEVNVTGLVGGGVFEGNYIEVDGLYGSGSTGVINTSAGVIGIRIGPNYYSNGGFTYPTFSAASTPLPPCSTGTGAVSTNHGRATVTDAITATIGAAYVSGGTLRVDVVCIGGVWTSTGAASY